MLGSTCCLFSVLQYCYASVCSYLVSITVSFHLLFLYSSHALRFLYIMFFLYYSHGLRFLYILLFSPFLLHPAFVLHLSICSHSVHTIIFITYGSTHFTGKNSPKTLFHNIFPFTHAHVIRYTLNLKNTQEQNLKCLITMIHLV
jgi:hypothetical protein